MKDEVAIASHLIALHNLLGQRTEKGKLPSLKEFKEMAKEDDIPEIYIERYLETKHPQLEDRVITMFE